MFPDIEVTLTGITDLNFRNGENVVAVQASSLALAFPLIILTIAAFLRAGRLLPLIAVANLFPVVVCLGVMGWTGVPLNMGTALVGSIALGLVVDDAVYLVARIAEMAEEEGTLERLVGAALAHVGPALLSLYNDVELARGVLDFLAAKDGA